MKERLKTCSKMVGNLIPTFDNASIHAEDDSDLPDTSFELTDKGVVIAAKMKIAFSLIPGSSDNIIKEFMERVDDDLSRMSSLPVPSSLSTLGQVLKSTKAIMDQFSQVVHISSIIIANPLIKVIRYTRYSMHRGPLFPVFTG